MNDKRITDAIRFLDHDHNRLDLASAVQDLEQRAEGWEKKCRGAWDANKLSNLTGFNAGKRQGRIDALARLDGASKRLLKRIEKAELKLRDARLALEGRDKEK